MYWVRSGVEIHRSRRSLVVVAGMKKVNYHAKPTKVNTKNPKNISVKENYLF